MSNNINIIETLIKKIKENNIKWMNLDFFKKYLKNNDKALRDIQVLQSYSVYLQKSKFLFNCIDTYFSISDEHLYILSKSLNTFEFRFDVYTLCNEKSEWTQIDAPIHTLLRLKNAIMLTNEDSNDECIDILSVLG